MVASAASAANNGFAGALCNPDTPTDGGKIGRSATGVFNTSASTANVSCGSSVPIGADVNRIEATVYDRHNVGNVCCSMMVLSANGTILSSSAPCSVGSGAAAQTLSYVPPLNTAHTVDLACSIPAFLAGSGHSHVATYRVQSNP